MPSNEQVVRAVMDFYNARNLEGFISCFSPDIVEVDGEGNQLVKGLENMRQHYAKLFDGSPRLHAETMVRIVGGQYVFAEIHETGINFEGLPSELHLAAVFHVVDRKIIRAQMFLLTEA